MGLFIASLNSGSNGNSYYIGNDTTAVLVDAGLSCREIENRMKRLQLDLSKVKAVFISHEHTDHIRGVELLSRKHQLPVYITDRTRRNGRVKLGNHLSRTFTGSSPISIEGIDVVAFNKFHDAADPYSFMISCNGVNVGVFTDIGRPCANLVHHFKQCHAAFLESNYDEVMLQNGNYPFHLKKRISGGNGHLSNTEALELFKTNRPPWMSHLLLSHLSQHNNKPEIVKELFDAHANGVEMIVASRHEPSAVFRISSNTVTLPVKTKLLTRPQQLQIQFG